MSDDPEKLKARIKQLEGDLEMEKILHQAARKDALRLRDRLDMVTGKYNSR